MKKFFVSKNDKAKIDFLQKAIKQIKPSDVFIMCENDRASIFKDIEAKTLPLKELNKSENWLNFVNTFSKHSLLVVDNILKFIYFGDGKKEHLKNISQGIDNIIVMDVVPFYTEPHEIFYPFWFLGKDILGYNSYQSFKSNHLEEKKDGNIDLAHSFSVLKEKIKDYYIQDYDNFFNDVSFVEFLMSEQEVNNYNIAKEKYANINNPILLYRSVSTYINIINSRFDSAKNLLSKLEGKTAIVINYMPNAKKYKKLIGDYDYISFNSDVRCFGKYDNILFLKMPIVKHHNIFYVLQNQAKFYQLQVKNNNLDKYFFNKIYGNLLRSEFDKYFNNLS